MRRIKEVSSQFKQRIVIQFCVLIGKSATETRVLLGVAFGAQCLSKARIHHWHRSFKQGCVDIVDRPRAARRRVGRSDQHIQAVKTLVEGDRRLSVTALSSQTGIPPTTVFRILRLDLHLIRKTAKFVPHLLTEGQKQLRKEVASNLLTRVGMDNFLDTVVTMDESWMYQYDPELKQQSSQWLHSRDRRPVKCMRERTTGKVMLVSFDMRGMIHMEFFHRTITAEIFVEVLQRFRTSVLNSRGIKYLKDCSLHMDNASPHTAFETRKYLIQAGQKVVQHPPYSPDLAPSDFWLYPRLKKNLRGKRYDNLNYLKEAVRKEVGNISSEEFRDCIVNTWPRRWARCVHENGVYFEGATSIENP